VTSFEEHCRRMETAAASTAIPGFITVADSASLDAARTYTVRDRPGSRLIEIGNDWTRRLFDGPFYRSASRDAARPAVNLVFVQSRDLNTVADDPSTLGGGAGDKHLIYEGLSRVDAGAVLAGATTARGERMVFSVWHPELVRLRLERGHPRHPAQVIVTDRGDLKIERALMFQAPELPVFIIAKSSSVAALQDRVHGRPWIQVIDAGEPLSMTRGLRELHARGITVVSAVGGRRTATSMLLEGLVDDIYLTTSPITGGEPHTPFYEGSPLPLELVVAKAALGDEAGVRFEHFVLRG
jgi:riboflavin biosynthesis pyrimidine reductase